MNIFLNKIKSFSTMAIIFAGLFFANIGFPVDTYAYTPVTNAISISPLWQKIILLPGESYRGTFTLSNPSTSTTSLDYNLRVAPYSIAANDYNNPKYDIESTSTQITDWVTYDWTEGTIGIGDSVEIPYTINVPEDAPAGGQYAVLFASGSISHEDDSSNAMVTDIREIGTIIYATVAGETNMSGEILNNNIPGFVTSNSIIATSTINNTGNVHAEASYKLQVFPLFSDEEVFTNEEDPETKLILPDTSYYSTVEWNETPSIGIFKVIQTVEFLGESSTVEKIVIVCPLWLLFVIIFAVILLILWIIAKSKSHKKSAK